MLLVAGEGLNALTPFGERPAHPIVTSVLRDVGGGAPLDLGRVWPAIFAVAIASSRRRPRGGGRRGTPLGGCGARGGDIAASPFVALTAIGYAPNLLVDVFAVAAVALAVRVRSGGRGVTGVILCSGRPRSPIGSSRSSSWRSWRPTPPGWCSRRGSGRGTRLAGSSAAAPGTRPWRRPRRHPPARVAGAARPDPSAHQGTAAGKIASRLPEMALGVTIPLAAVGGAVMWASRRPTTTRVLPPLALWALAAPAGLIAWKAFDLTIPHRTVPIALGVPALIVLGAAATRAWTDAMASRPERRSWVRISRREHGPRARGRHVAGAPGRRNVDAPGGRVHPGAVRTGRDPVRVRRDGAAGHDDRRADEARHLATGPCVDDHPAGRAVPRRAGLARELRGRSGLLP